MLHMCHHNLLGTHVFRVAYSKPGPVDEPVMIKEPYIITPEIEQILSVHEQLWSHNQVITYKDQTEFSHTPSHQGYCSVILKNANDTPHMWITNNMNKSTYGTLAIQRAQKNKQELRITWIIRISDNQYILTGQIRTHKYFNSDKLDSIRIETYKDDVTTVVYDNDPKLYKVKSIL